MIHFNELYVTEDGKNLVIDAEIDDITAFNQCVIDSISVNIGKNCAAPLRNAVVVYDKPSFIAGDLNNDGEITEEDYNNWMTLDDLCKYALLHDDGGYYYRKKDADDIHFTSYYVPQNIVDLMRHILSKYEPVKSLDNQLEFTHGHLLAYVIDQLGGFALDGSIPRFPGDINGDGEVNVSDLNAFYDYLSQVLAHEHTPIKSSKGSRHVRLCLNSSDLAPLVEGKDLSEYLFIVNVHAAVLGGHSEIAKIECGIVCTDDSINGVAYNGKPLYDSAVMNANAYGDTCATNDMSQFVDWLLRYYGFLFALKSGDLCAAQRYWTEYLQGNSASGFRSSNPCGCHGARR